MSKIYTKTGDKGKTSLFNGQRVLKSNLRVETYGSVDELNTILGIVVSNTKDTEIKDLLQTIQSDLFEIGSALANPDSTQLPFLTKQTAAYEESIDEMTKKLAPLQNFILPGGSNSASFAHLARTVSRRTERRLVNLSQTEDIDPNILAYFNRLSDLFFTIARYLNNIEKQKEIIWEKR